MTEMFKVNNLDIAKRVLDEAKAELKVDEIAARAVQQGLVTGTTPEDLKKKLSASLNLSVKRKDSPFTKVKNAKGGFKAGVFRLKRSAPRQEPLPIGEPAAITDTGFVGKGGEYAVMSELLFRGFNVSLMSVDKGVDIVAANENDKYFHIQVKTANDKEGVYVFNIKRKTFDANRSSSTFYVFVLRRDNKSLFVIMPDSQLVNYVALGVVKGADYLSVRLSYDPKTRKCVLNGSQDVSIYINRFGQIC